MIKTSFLEQPSAGNDFGKSLCKMLRSRTAIQRAQFARKTYLLNCHSQNPEKLAVTANQYLWGAHKAIFHPHQDTGDCLILINTRHVQLEGNKWEETFIDEFHRAHGMGKLIMRELHLLEPTKVMRYALKKVINEPPNLAGKKYKNKDDFHINGFELNQVKWHHDIKRPHSNNWGWEGLICTFFNNNR